MLALQKRGLLKDAARMSHQNHAQSHFINKSLSDKFYETEFVIWADLGLLGSLKFMNFL